MNIAPDTCLVFEMVIIFIQVRYAAGLQYNIKTERRDAVLSLPDTVGVALPQRIVTNQVKRSLRVYIRYKIPCPESFPIGRRNGPENPFFYMKSVYLLVLQCFSSVSEEFSDKQFGDLASPVYTPPSAFNIGVNGQRMHIERRFVRYSRIEQVGPGQYRLQLRIGSTCPYRFAYLNAQQGLVPLIGLRGIQPV